MTESYGRLNLRGWPFQTVPSEYTATIWVGRPEIYKRFRTLLRSVQRVNASRIVLLWAAYGAGKTHALLHMKVTAGTAEGLQTLYVVTPKGIKGFLDIYRAIIDAALSTDMLSELGIKIYSRMGAAPPTDLQRALVRIVSLPEPQHRSALAWLKAEKVPARELRDSGLSRRLETSTDGIETLNELIGLLRAESETKLMLLFDEMQELGQLSSSRLDEAVGGLHKVFDRNTDGLTFVFCFMTTAQVTVAKIIGDTLFERRSDTLTLPPLSRDDAVEFVMQLVREWSIAADQVPYPFTKTAIEAVVDALPAEDGFTPRNLIRAYDAILRSADLDIEDGIISEIDAAYALDRLAEDGLV
jgi:hypothetical protein